MLTDPRASAPPNAGCIPKPSKLARRRPRQLARPPGACSTAPRGVGKSSLAVDAGAIFLNIEDEAWPNDAVLHVPRGRRARRRRERWRRMQQGGDDLAGNDRLRHAVAINPRSMPLESRLLAEGLQGPTGRRSGASATARNYTVALAGWARLLTRLSRLRGRHSRDHPPGTRSSRPRPRG